MERIWFDRDRESFFSIPDNVTLAEGDLPLRTVTGLRKSVDPEAVAPYRISRAEATDRLGARIDDAWGSLVGGVDRIFAAGRRAARQAGVPVSDGDGEDSPRSPLPEHLSDWLGMSPGEILTDPEKIRTRLREVAATAGIHITPRSPEAAEDAEEADAETEDTAEGEGEEKKAAEDPFREFLRRPEVSDALSGFGRALSRLGARLQDAGRPAEPPAEE